jgi:hypothetical protein
MSPPLKPALGVHGDVSQGGRVIEAERQTDGYDEGIENCLLARSQSAALVKEYVEVEENREYRSPKPSQQPNDDEFGCIVLGRGFAFPLVVFLDVAVCWRADFGTSHRKDTGKVLVRVLGGVAERTGSWVFCNVAARRHFIRSSKIPSGLPAGCPVRGTASFAGGRVGPWLGLGE